MAVETSTTTLRIKPGETFRFVFSVTSGKEKSVYPLTGFTASMSIKDAITNGTEVFAISSASGLTINEAAGRVTGVFTAAQTDDLVYGTAYYTSIHLVSTEDTIISGIIKIITEPVV